MYGIGEPAYTGGFIGGYLTYSNAWDWKGTNTVKNCVNLGKLVNTLSDFSFVNPTTSYRSYGYHGAITGAYRSDDNAYKHVTVVNCYYLANNILDTYGNTKDIGKGGSSLTQTIADCTAVASASAAHTCVSVTHKEVRPTCAGYPGRSQYS